MIDPKTLPLGPPGADNGGGEGSLDCLLEEAELFRSVWLCLEDDLGPERGDRFADYVPSAVLPTLPGFDGEVLPEGLCLFGIVLAGASIEGVDRGEGASAAGSTLAYQLLGGELVLAPLQPDDGGHLARVPPWVLPTDQLVHPLVEVHVVGPWFVYELAL